MLESFLINSDYNGALRLDVRENRFLNSYEGHVRERSGLFPPVQAVTAHQNKMAASSDHIPKTKRHLAEDSSQKGCEALFSFFFTTIFYIYVNKYIFVTEPEWRDIFAPDISSYVILIVWWLLMNSCHNGGFRWDVWKNRLLIFSTEYHLRERIHRCSDFRQQRETILRWF